MGFYCNLVGLRDSRMGFYCNLVGLRDSRMGFYCNLAEWEIAQWDSTVTWQD